MLELSNSSLPDEFADTAVAIGKFDGIHLGISSCSMNSYIFLKRQAWQPRY